MKRYTLGLAMTEDHIVLISKTKPLWQKGKYNFVGGKIEPDEEPIDCMVREFVEETGVQTEKSDWNYLGKMEREGNFECFIYVSNENDKFKNVQSITEERVFLLEREHFEFSLGFQKKFMSNLLTFYHYARSDDYRDYKAEMLIKYPPEIEELHH